ncbi:hypothetical protein B0H19DRAFT_1233918 [Mycena capillaripes]|nr:hypothetical protein B0H19DRAFT_1233918 [Mycena capillaripes]
MVQFTRLFALFAVASVGLAASVKRTNGADVAAALNGITTTVAALDAANSLTEAEADAMIAEITILVVKIELTATDLMAARSCLKSLGALGGVIPLVIADLTSLQAKAINLAAILISRCPSSRASQVIALKVRIDVAFEKCIASYKS